jgi:phosphoribosylamine--glycine ligase
MNVLLLGSGGREHALAWKISQSPLLNKLFIAPGNAGTSFVGSNVELNPLVFETVGHFALQQNIDIVIVGPEDPLVLGIVDYFEATADIAHIPVIGPTKAGAMLEGSKDFSKIFMQKYQIPTAAYQTFSKGEEENADKFLDTLTSPYVLKADGLAAGKGVLILDDKNLAKSALREMLDGKFGLAGNKVVIEEFLQGMEVSVFVLTDGKNYILLPEAKDYKRIGEFDTGLNTGGMGAVSPVPFMTPELMVKIEKKIIRPTIEGLQAEGIKYKGFIFFGLMINEGEPYVIEYNCRMGDPETEVVMPRLENDLLELFVATSKNELGRHVAHIDNDTATTVMVVSGGYPEKYRKNIEISGLNEDMEGLVFHAGTRRHEESDAILTNGGRVLAFTGIGENLKDALKMSYNDIKKICFDGMYFRKDIGEDLM